MRGLSFLVAAVLLAPSAAEARKRDPRRDDGPPAKRTAKDDGTHLGVRVGSAQLALVPSADTPVLGGYFTQAVDAYNAGAQAWSATHGGAGVPRMTHDDLALTTDLVLVTPTLDVGGDGFFFRLDVPLGFGDGVRTYGLGLYPIAWSGRLAPSAALYTLVGASASYVRTVPAAITGGGAEAEGGAHGALLQGRAALGLKLGAAGGWSLGVEVGFGFWNLGGVVDFERLSAMEGYDPRGMAPPPTPDQVTRGGEQRGLVDVSITVAMP